MSENKNSDYKNKKFIKVWGEQIFKEIASRNYRKKYDAIKEFPDYAYTYCIAYEMLIRTKEYAKFKKMNKYNDNGMISLDWVNTMKSLGLDINSLDKEMEILLKKDHNKNEPIIKMEPYFRTISDIDDGLRKLITFYIKKKKIRQVKQEYDRSFGLPVLYEESTKASLEDVLSNLEMYHIPYNIEAYTIFGSDLELSENIPLYRLEMSFLSTLALNDFQEKYISIQPNFPRPILHFKESKIVSLPINLNLNKKELVAYISEIKDEYDGEFLKVQAPLDLIGETLKSVLPRSKNKLSLSTKKMKKTMADAFYVYDTFEKLKLEASKNKKSPEMNHQKNEYNTDSIYDFLVYAGQIPASYVKPMNEFMRDYIDRLKYKELITSIQPYK